MGCKIIKRIQCQLKIHVLPIYILLDSLQFTNICKNVALVSTSLQVPYFTHSDLITFPVDELYEIKSPVMLIHRELTATSCSK